MKFFQQNRPLAFAIAASVLVHGMLLAVHFAAPEAFKFKPTDPGLEVILVNAKHDRAPVKAEALAQANLDGGGNAEKGRAQSPLPNRRKSEDGDSLKAMQRRIDEYERQQQRALAQLRHKKPPSLPAHEEAPRNTETPPVQAADQDRNSSEILRREAEIARNIEDYNKRPKKTQITPSTREVGYAMYYKTLQNKIEKIGTLNFPQQDGRKLYGELVIYIPVFQDGTLYEKEGGAKVQVSSGNPALDKAALRIVQRAAPFGRFPSNMRSTDKDDVWEIITRFKFARDDTLATDSFGGVNP